MAASDTDIVIDAGNTSDVANIEASGLVTDWKNGGHPFMFASYEGTLRKVTGRWKIESLTATMMAGALTTGAT